MITELKENQIFVFGSNMAGNHAGGAALQALKWGAVNGQGEGLQGQAYAFPTLDEKMKKVSFDRMWVSRDKLYHCCDRHPDKEFLMTKVGCGIAGFDEIQIRGVFIKHPDNLILPEDWQ